MGNPQAMTCQKAYLRHLVEVVNEFDNIYSEIADENAYSPERELPLCEFITGCETAKPSRHLVMPTDLPGHSDLA